jgi:hypothetical protein
MWDVSSRVPCINCRDTGIHDHPQLKLVLRKRSNVDSPKRQPICTISYTCKEVDTDESIVVEPCHHRSSYRQCWSGSWSARESQDFLRRHTRKSTLSPSRSRLRALQTTFFGYDHMHVAVELGDLRSSKTGLPPAPSLESLSKESDNGCS